MLVQGQVSGGYTAPAVPNTTHGKYNRGYYNPSFQISGVIDQTGPFPQNVEAGNKFVTFVSKMNLRESASTKGVKVGKTTAINEPYVAVAYSWGSPKPWAELKIADHDLLWALVADPTTPDKPVGWACVEENVKVAQPKELLKVYYAAFATKVDSAKLSEDALKTAQAEKKTQVEAMTKWAKANSPPPVPNAPKLPAIGSEQSSSSLGLTAGVLAGSALLVWLVLRNK